jgi:cell division transport system permease protein
LFFVVGALCFLAALAALTTRGTYTAAKAWGAQIEGEVTIQLRDIDRRAAETASDMVAGLPGVKSSRLMSPQEVDEALEPFFGTGGMPAGLPRPLIIVVEALSDDGTLLAPQIKRALDDQGLDAVVSSNWQYSDDVEDLLGVLRVIALGIVVLLSATAIAVIAFATHAALLARRDIVDVLHLSGAEDRYIAGLFERRFWVLALKAGAGGATAALMVTALIVFSGSSAGEVEAQLLPRLSLDFWDLLILLVTPVAAGLAARMAARLTVMASLKETL